MIECINRLIKLKDCIYLDSIAGWLSNKDKDFGKLEELDRTYDELEEDIKYLSENKVDDESLKLVQDYYWRAFNLYGV